MAEKRDAEDALLREQLEQHIEALCAGHCAPAELKHSLRLPPPGIKMVETGFDSEASFLHHCLECGPVDRTGAEYTCSLIRAINKLP